jgi:hypothetical protein
MYMRRSVAIRQRQSAVKPSSTELITINSGGKRIVAGYSNCRSLSY